jgi:hypothetical protein
LNGRYDSIISMFMRNAAMCGAFLAALLAVPALSQAPLGAGPAPPATVVPPFPPDGTYAYAIFRGDKRVGATQVTVSRDDANQRIDLFESGSYDGVSVVGMHDSLNRLNLLPTRWDARYPGKPFMSAYLALPSVDAASTRIAASSAFPFWTRLLAEPVTPIHPKAALDNWPNDVGLSAGDATIYYDARTGIVHEAWFKGGLRTKLIADR